MVLATKPKRDWKKVLKIVPQMQPRKRAFEKESGEIQGQEWVVPPSPGWPACGRQTKVGLPSLSSPASPSLIVSPFLCLCSQPVVCLSGGSWHAHRETLSDPSHCPCLSWAPSVVHFGENRREMQAPLPWGPGLPCHPGPWWAFGDLPWALQVCSSPSCDGTRLCWVLSSEDSSHPESTMFSLMENLAFWWLTKVCLVLSSCCCPIIRVGESIPAVLLPADPMSPVFLPWMTGKALSIHSAAPHPGAPALSWLERGDDRGASPTAQESRSSLYRDGIMAQCVRFEVRKNIYNNHGKNWGRSMFSASFVELIAAVLWGIVRRAECGSDREGCTVGTF